jgi:hypothetical protein
MIDEGDCGAIGGMKIGRGNRSARRKPADSLKDKCLRTSILNDETFQSKPNSEITHEYN